MNKEFQNYHKHTCWSNISTPDSPTLIDAYVNRIIELGHTVFSSVEHGWQGHYYRVWEAVKEKNLEFKKRRENGEVNVPKDLKFIFGAEAYWVKDRFEKDSSNCHIILLAKNEEGRREINDILSEANITGYYSKPRVDLDLLMKLNKENVMITTACLMFWRYEDIEEILVRLHKHFEDSLYLEVQYHNTEPQKQINLKILELSNKYNIQMIMGCDSHYILKTDSQERDNYLEARGIRYEDEEGWYLDYPSYETAFTRFQEQGVLSDKEIITAMDNTNIILTFDDIEFNDDIKLPSLYPDKSQEWKDNKLRDLINLAWKRDYVPFLSKEKKKEYIDGIRNELETITGTKMTDYFLLDYEIVKEGKARGGIISPTARGSGGSFFINTLLGFSNLNRFEAPVKLYPERFMSKTRILKTKSLPDLDLNLGTVDIFADVQKELLGENHAYPMIAFGQLKDSSAFKMYCKSQGVPFEIANEVNKQIKAYEKALSNAEDDDAKELIHLYDYVDIKYEKYINESKKYRGIINSKSAHPCGYLLYQGDIRREIGLIKCKSESTKKEVITTVIDGYVAEKYKFVKNDLLKVDVANTVQKIYDSIGIERHTIKELTDIIAKDKKTWGIYANGFTLGVNQMESKFGVQCCKQYKPTNVAEMTALVSALRPGFKSMLSNFLARKPYSTGIMELDNLLKDSFHYIMYQESIMTYLGWLNIEQTETYAIIKKISKKKFKEKELAELKKKLSKAWMTNTGSLDGFEESFQIVEDFSRYAFNASHAYAYAYDSLYGAYLKANYPYHFYSIMLQTYTEKGKKDKVTAYKKEMKEAFGIEEGEYKFRLDNRKFSIDLENHKIHPCLSSIKDMGKNVAQELYELKDNNYESFIELLRDLKPTSINAKMLDILIKIDYFSEFGNPNQLLEIVKIFEQWESRKTIKKDKIVELGYDVSIFKEFGHKTEKQFNRLNSEGIINMLLSFNNKKTSIRDRLIYEYNCLDYCTSSYPKHKDKCLVLDIDTKYTPRITAYKLDGQIIEFKVYKNPFKVNPFEKLDLLQIGSTSSRQKQSRIGTDENGKGLYEPVEGKFDTYLNGWKVLNPKQ